MRVLVTGAYGFIGAHITAALLAAGHEVTCAVRGARLDTRFPGIRALACDMARDIHPADWRPRLAGIDAVINAAGILRETRSDSFAAVHEAAPLALWQACVEAGIRRVIQISALGDPADGAFIASKHRGDAALAALDLDWLVLRPSLVYSARGAYGGTSLLRALAALPGVLVLPAGGRQRLQPIAAEDVALAVTQALARPAAARETLALVGPETLTLTAYLMAWRRWLGYGRARVLGVPRALTRLVAWCGEKFGSGPLGQTMLRMLERGNHAGAEACARQQAVLGLAPRPLARVLAETPSAVQDRWHARLYFWLPALRLGIAALWLISGLTGWLVPREALQPLAATTPFDTATLLLAARATATLDLVLGVLCLGRWQRPRVLGLMLVMLLGYTLGVALLWPALWLEPFGGLAKNLPLLAALAILIVTDERR